MARPREIMPQFVEDALQREGLRAACDARPPYQRNDWLTWINSAKRPETRSKRLQSMLAELRAGHGHMGVAWQLRHEGKSD